MLIELAIVLLLIVFCLTIFFTLVYFGLFEELVVKAGPPPYQFGGRVVYYKKQRGCYSDSSAVFTEVSSLTPSVDTFGIYFDEPQKVKNNNKCRYIVGALLNQQNHDFEQQKHLLISKGFSGGQLPDVDHVVYTLFPFKGVVSVVIAIRRVYPLIKSFIVEHNLCAHPAIEVYSSNKIFFMFPLAKQDQFYQLYRNVANNDDSGEDNSADEEDDEEDVNDNDVLIDPPNNENNVLEDTVSDTGMRLRNSKGSKHSSTSSSFEELLAEDNGKDS